MAQNNDRSSSEPLMGRAGNRVLWWILEAVGLSSLDLFTGFSGAIATVFPQADVQKCIVHQPTFPRRMSPARAVCPMYRFDQGDFG